MPLTMPRSGTLDARPVLLMISHALYVRNYVVSGFLRALASRVEPLVVIAPQSCHDVIRDAAPDLAGLHVLESAPVSPRRRQLLGWIRNGSFVRRAPRQIEYRRSPGQWMCKKQGLRGGGSPKPSREVQ